jgi:hypothetical protein
MLLTFRRCITHFTGPHRENPGGRLWNGNRFKHSLWRADISRGTSDGSVEYLPDSTTLTGDIRTLYILLSHRAVNSTVPHDLQPLILFPHATSPSIASLPRGFALWPFPSSCRGTDWLTSTGVTVSSLLLQSVSSLVFSRFVCFAVQMHSVHDRARSHVESETFQGFEEAEIPLQYPNMKCTLSAV